MTSRLSSVGRRFLRRSCSFIAGPSNVEDRSSTRSYCKTKLAVHGRRPERARIQAYMLSLLSFAALIETVAVDRTSKFTLSTPQRCGWSPQEVAGGGATGRTCSRTLMHKLHGLVG